MMTGTDPSADADTAAAISLAILLFWAESARGKRALSTRLKRTKRTKRFIKPSIKRHVLRTSFVPMPYVLGFQGVLSLPFSFNKSCHTYCSRGRNYIHSNPRE